MKLILLRHADAEVESATTGGDFGRALTERGRAQARDTGAHLSRVLGGSLPVLLTSPLRRTIQTAEIIASFTPPGTLRVAEQLRPGQSLVAAVALAQGSEETTVLVGHEPTLGELGAQLLQRRGLPFAFERGACLIFARDDNGLRFESYRPPFGAMLTIL